MLTLETHPQGIRTEPVVTTHAGGVLIEQLRLLHVYFYTKHKFLEKTKLNAHWACFTSSRTWAQSSTEEAEKLSCLVDSKNQLITETLITSVRPWLNYRIFWVWETEDKNREAIGTAADKK